MNIDETSQQKWKSFNFKYTSKSLHLNSVYILKSSHLNINLVEEWRRIFIKMHDPNWQNENAKTVLKIILSVGKIYL